MELRPYQSECLDAIRARYKAGKRRVLVSLPTGTGKTVIFAQLPKYFGIKRRMLVLAHREELLEQAAEKFRALAPEVTVGIEQANRSAGDARVVVASVASLRGARLERIDPEQFYLTVVDEAHHAVAPSYRAIFERLRLFEPNTARMLVGFTATPRRGDGSSLGEVFEDIAFSRGLEEMVAAGYLSTISGWRVKTELDLDGIKVRHGDFIESQLARAVNVPERNALLVRAQRELAAGRRTVVFCADVAHTVAVAEAFRGAGMEAEPVWGAMPRADRAAALARFRAGATQVLTNCNLLTEGFDEPRLDCVLMARPTQSLLLYAQMVGRGTRLAEGKRDLVVIDVVDNSRKHTLAHLNRLFELPEQLDLCGASVQEVAEAVRRLGAAMPWIDLGKVARAGELPLVAERFDLFRFEPPEEIAPATELCWLPAAAGGYRLGVGGGNRVVLRPTLLGTWELLRIDRAGRESAAMPILARTPADAVRVADEVVRRRFPEQLRVLVRDAAWRDRPPSEKQLELLRRKGVPTPAGLTRGQAERMIAYVVDRVG